MEVVVKKCYCESCLFWEPFMSEGLRHAKGEKNSKKYPVQRLLWRAFRAVLTRLLESKMELKQGGFHYSESVIWNCNFVFLQLFFYFSESFVLLWKRQEPTNRNLCLRAPFSRADLFLGPLSRDLLRISVKQPIKDDQWPWKLCLTLSSDLQSMTKERDSNMSQGVLPEVFWKRAYFSHWHEQ